MLEINVADEQCEDILDDSIQYFQERHFDGVARTYMKYKLTQADIDRGTANLGENTTNAAGITTMTASTTINNQPLTQLAH